MSISGDRERRRGISRRRFLGGAGAVLTLGAVGFPAGEALAQRAKGDRKLRLHVLSDTHISNVYPVTQPKMGTSLEDLMSAAPDADALIINGDLTEYGKPEDYELFDRVLANYPHPETVLVTNGNHEYHNIRQESFAAQHQRYLEYAGLETVYYEREIKGYGFVFLGMDSQAPSEVARGVLPFAGMLSEEQLDWLEQTLDRRAGQRKPTFLFLHQPPDNVVQRARLEEILRAHPNVIYFWGHYHVDNHWYTQGPDTSLFREENGYWRSHIGSTTYLWRYTRRADGTVQRTFDGNLRQGLIVDIYQDRVDVGAQDFAKHQMVPGFGGSIPIIRPGVRLLGVAGDRYLRGPGALKVSVSNTTVNEVRVTVSAQVPEGWETGSVTEVLAPNRVSTIEVPITPPLRGEGVTTETIPVTLAAQGSGVPVYASPREVIVNAVPEPEGENLAPGGQASASSSHPNYPAARAIDGNRNSEDWGAKTGWNDNTSKQYPDWLEVRFAGAQRVGRVDVYTLDASRFPASRWGLRDYDVQVELDGGWKTVEEVRGNVAGLVVSKFEPLETEAVRVFVMTTNGTNEYSRVIELETYAG